MNISELINVIKLHFDEHWINDETLLDNNQGNEDEIKQEFIKTIQAGLGFDFVVISKEQLDKKLNDYNKSMEGYY